MGKDSNFIVIGAEIWCDCGSKPSYLKSGKSSQVGNEYVMLNTHTDPQKNFSNNFGICFGYNNNGNECKMRLLSNWFGSKDDIIYKDYSYQKNVKSYYTHLSNCSKYLVSVLGVIMPQFTTYTGHGVSSNEISNFIRGIGSYNLEIDSKSDALFDIERLQNDIEKTKDYLEKIDPSKLTSQDIVILGQLQNAEDELNSAKSLFNQISSSNEELGKQLIETSVLICKNGGVIYIKENGQFQENDNFLHGFTPDLQYIYLQGNKYEIYVPTQPQTTTYKELTKDWKKVHSDAVSHKGFDLSKFLPFGKDSDYETPSSDLEIKDINTLGTIEYTSFLDDITSNAQGVNTDIASINISPTGEVLKGNAVQREQAAALSLDNTYYNERPMHIPGLGTKNLSAAKVEAAATIVTAADQMLKSLINRVGDCLIRYDVFFDFFVTNGRRIVTIRWFDYQLKRFIEERANKIYTMDAFRGNTYPETHARASKTMASQQYLEQILTDNSFLKIPKEEPERSEFFESHLGQEERFLPEFYTTKKNRYKNYPEYPLFGSWWGYNSQLYLSDFHTKSGELGYLHYDTNKKLQSTLILYDADTITVGWDKLNAFASGTVNYTTLFDLRQLLSEEEAFPIYHFFIYSWGNLVTNPNKEDLVQAIYGFNEEIPAIWED